MKVHRTKFARDARGFTLIEILISLVIGLVVIGAVLVSMLGSGRAGRYQTAYTQMNEDAQIAISILSRELQLSGYSEPTALVPQLPAGPTPMMVLSFGTLGTSTYVLGCDTGFSDPRAATLVCGTATAAAFEVVYEADIKNTVPAGSPLRPSDCRGFPLTANAAGKYVARNRYFLTSTAGRPELSCATEGTATTSQPLIENIENMAIMYGVSSGPTSNQVVRYVTATQLRAQGAAQWFNVISVRICLLVRSAEPVLDIGEDSVIYRDCTGTAQTTADRYLRRAYFTTAAIRNMMP